jgi:hypothetical protein
MTHTRYWFVEASRPADIIKQAIAALGHGLA